LDNGFAHAQQTPFFSHYYLNPYLINPAMAGQSKETRAFLLYRQQWWACPALHKHKPLTIDGPLTETRFGLGLTAINDVTNFIHRSSAMVTGSYAVPLATDRGTLCIFGLEKHIEDLVNKNGRVSAFELF
jgi:type IX secretion system PorP/SprF family membrane protein